MSTRKMTGFLATLTPEQKKRALAYRGPDTLGSPLTLERDEMRHADYNAFVQRVQSDCASWGAENEVVAMRSDTGEIRRAELRVYWDGRWHVIASEVPFVPESDRDFHMDEMGWTKLQAEMADALMSS